MEGDGRTIELSEPGQRSRLDEPDALQVFEVKVRIRTPVRLATAVVKAGMLARVGRRRLQSFQVIVKGAGQSDLANAERIHGRQDRSKIKCLWPLGRRGTCEDLGIEVDLFPLRLLAAQKDASNQATLVLGAPDILVVQLVTLA